MRTPDRFDRSGIRVSLVHRITTCTAHHHNEKCGPRDTSEERVVGTAWTEALPDRGATGAVR